MRKHVSDQFIRDAREIAPRVEVDSEDWWSTTLLKIGGEQLVKKLFYGPYLLRLLDDDTYLVYQNTPDVVRPSGHLGRDPQGNCAAVILTKMV